MYPFDEYPPTPHSESEDTEILDVEMSELSVLGMISGVFRLHCSDN